MTTTTKLLFLTLLLAATVSVCGVSSAEEAKDSTITEIVSAKDSDLRNEEALRVAIGDFDDVEFSLSAEEMATIANSADVSLNGISTQGGERSVTSMFSGEASEQVETTQSASTTFNGALTFAYATNSYETVTVRQSAVARSLSSDNSTEQYATDAGKSYYEQVSTSNSGSAVTTYSATSFLGNSNSVGDTDTHYGTSYLSYDIVPYATSRTWEGGSATTVDGEHYYYYWSTIANWGGSWVDGDNATFNASGSSYTTVTVDTAITAGTIKVTGGADYTFNYETGASLEATDNVTIGNSSGSGSLTITGGTTTFGDASSDSLYVGNAGTGSLTISGDDTKVTVTAGTRIGYSYNSSGSLTLANGETSFSNYVYVGDNYGTGTLTISGGTNTFSGSNLYVGNIGTGTIEISDGTNTFSGSNLYVGNIGIGELTISGGTNTFSGSNLYVGYTGTGTIEISGGTNTFSGTVYVGNYGTGTLTITGGETTFSGTTSIGSSNSLSIGGGDSVATVNLDAKIGTSATGNIVISDNANIVLSGALLASIEALAESGGDSVVILEASSITINSTTLLNQDSDAIATIIGSSISAEGYDLTWSYSSTNGTLSVTGAVATPEPALFSVFFGVGALGLVATRRCCRRVA